MLSISMSQWRLISIDYDNNKKFWNFRWITIWNGPQKMFLFYWNPLIFIFKHGVEDFLYFIRNIYFYLTFYYFPGSFFLLTLSSQTNLYDLDVNLMSIDNIITIEVYLVLFSATNYRFSAPNRIDVVCHSNFRPVCKNFNLFANITRAIYTYYVKLPTNN